MLLVFDGDCGFCRRSALWIERRLPLGARVMPWQSLNLEELGLTRKQVEDAAWWFGQHDGTGSDGTGSDVSAATHAQPDSVRAVSGHAAIGQALAAAGGCWGLLGRSILQAPLSWIARPVYTLIADHRHRFPGSGACRLADTESE